MRPASRPGTGIVIEIIEYDPPGLDAEGEYVDLRNEKFVTIDITGWTLRDESEAVFTFPSFSLAYSSASWLKGWNFR